MIFSVSLMGKQFSPAEVEDKTGLQLSEKLEVGEVVKRGRFKEKPSAIGRGTLSAPDHIPYEDRFDWLLGVLSEHINALYKMGAEPIQVDVGCFYTDQCNFELSPQELKALSELKIGINLSCYRR